MNVEGHLTTPEGYPGGPWRNAYGFEWQLFAIGLTCPRGLGQRVFPRVRNKPLKFIRWGPRVVNKECLRVHSSVLWHLRLNEILLRRSVRLMQRRITDDA